MRAAAAAAAAAALFFDDDDEDEEFEAVDETAAAELLVLCRDVTAFMETGDDASTALAAFRDEDGADPLPEAVAVAEASRPL